MTIVNTDLCWQEVIGNEKQLPYFINLMRFLEQEKSKGKIIYPEQKNVFNAIKTTPFNQVKVVIIGQDPYHGPNQAHGLCFSVPDNVALPPSLRNIYQELATDLNIKKPKHGNLTSWAEQGVLLLNSVLTVEAHKANSHANIGWETFTDAVISAINKYCNDIVFLLWGSHAKKKCNNIDHKHHILTTVHPSPLSSHRGFFGCKHFSKCNEILNNCGKKEIAWDSIV